MGLGFSCRHAFNEDSGVAVMVVFLLAFSLLLQPFDPPLDNSMGYRNGVLYVVGSVSPDIVKDEDVYMGYINAVNATDGKPECDRPAASGI